MRIRRIEVRNFRKLVDRVVIQDITDGVTVIAGDNEDGKSTILQALRAVLFDRHTLTGDAADAMQPFGHRVRPEICLDFEIDGSTYHLQKGFCQRPSAELRTPTGTLTGSEVEERLQELLRFRAPGRGPSRADEHHGVYGLFWVEQGRSFAPIAVNADNRGVLIGALDGEVRQVLGGARGRALKDVIARRYAEFYTEKTGRERGPLADAGRSAEDISRELEPLKEQLRLYEGRADELSRTRERLAQYEREGMLANARAALSEAKVRMTEVDLLRQGVRDARGAKALADANLQGPTVALKQRGEAVARAARDADALASARVRVDVTDQEFLSCTTIFETAVRTLQDLEAKLETAERELQKVEHNHERKRLETDAEQLTRVLADARSAEELARAARTKATLAKVDEQALRQLRKLEEKHIQANAALAGSSTLVRFRFDRDGVALIGGVAAPRNGEISIAEPTTIGIADFGSLSIIPGGKEISERREAAEKALRQLRESLRKLDADSVAQAETLWNESRRHRQEAENQEGIVAALAPDGIDALTSRLADANARLNLLPLDTGGTIEKSRDESRAAHRKAFDEVATIRTRRETAQEALGKAREDRARAQATLQSAGNTANESVAELKSARDQASDASLRDAFAEAGRQATLATMALDAAEEALRAADPEKCQLKFEQAGGSLENIENDITGLERSADRIAIELQAIGQRGLGESVQELEGRLALAVAKQKQLAREAACLKLLYETICRAEKLAREAFLAPVQERVRPYLRLLLPDAELVLSEADMGITHLRRAGQDEPYDALSVGAREQIAVLTRLAFADLLRERGIVAPVILDDALVNSDPRRFESMLLAIWRAARNLQIIVLTCHEATWMQAGAPIIRLTSCVQP